jgi:subtilisin family serine protease
MGDLSVRKINSYQEAQQYTPPVPAEYADDEVVIKFRAGVTFDPTSNQSNSPRLNEQLKEHGVRSAQQLHKKHDKKDKDAKSAKRNEAASNVGLDRIYTLKVPKGSNIQQIIRDLRQNAEIEYAEPNYKRKIQVIPNDPSYSLQWALPKINAPAAWDIATGVSTTVVAIIDTGIDRFHPDLANNIWFNAGEIPLNGLDDDGNGFIDDRVGWNFVNNNNSTLDGHMHGTHVAGICGAVGNDSNGIVGVNWAVKMMAINNCDSSGVALDSASLAAITYAVDNGANIINCSWGSFQYSQALQNAVDYAYANGCVIIASSGNEATEAPLYPASMNHVISVGATDSNDLKTDFSNYGSFLDVMAPGKGIYSSVPSGGYASADGTSMSSPFVSGLAALIKANNPAYTNDDIYQTIVTTAYDLGPSGWDKDHGYGRIDALAALQAGTPLRSKITSPMEGIVLNGTVNIIGTSSGPNFQDYIVEWGIGDAPSSWQTAGVTLTSGGLSPITNGTLATLDVTQIPSDGYFTIRLTSNNNLGKHYEYRLGARKNTYLKPGWPKDFPSIREDINLRDVNNDGKEEILATDNNNYVHILDENGVDINGWPKQGGMSSTHPVVAHLFNNNSIQIVSAGLTSVYAWNIDGSTAPGWPKTVSATIGTASAYCAAGDVDGDGLDEIISKHNNKAYLWKGDGTLFAGWPKTSSSEFNRPALADLNLDGKREVILTESSGILNAYDSTGNTLPGWNKTGLGANLSSAVCPAIGDVNKDGSPEVYYGTGNRVYAWRNDGTPISGWAFPLGGGVILSPVTLGDFSGDDALEIFVTYQSPMGSTGLYGWTCGGSPLSGFPKGEYPHYPAPLLIDADGDGKCEVITDEGPVVIDASGNFRLKIHKNDGTSISGFPFDTGWDAESLSTAPSFGDTDGDNKVEMIVSSCTITGGPNTPGSKTLFIFDMPGLFNPQNRSWRLQGYDDHYTCAIPVTVYNPIIPGVVRDGLAADINVQISTSSLSANWSGFIDPQPSICSITEYQYAIGTTPGATNIVNWTTNNLNYNFTQNSLSLAIGQTYYSTVRAINSAGLHSDVTSNGVTVLFPTPTATQTITDTITPSVTQTVTRTITQTVSSTPTITLTSTNTPTITVTPTITQTFTITPTLTPTKVVPNKFNAYNYPNPFNPNRVGTSIRAELPEAGKVTIRIYDSKGYLVKELAKDEQRQAGLIDFTWLGDDSTGKKVTQNVYFVSVVVTDDSGNQKNKKIVKVMVIK